MSNTELYHVKTSALSTEVGPKALAELAKLATAEEKIASAIDEINKKNYEIPSMLTEAILKAAKADDTIKLGDIYSIPSAARILNTKVAIALGIREINDDGKAVYTKAARKYFPEDKDDKDYQVKNTFRTNFHHKLKLCIQAAFAIQTKNIEVRRASGTLRLSGPTIEKTYGAPSILLNEQQTQGETELKAKPSFTATAALASPKNKTVGSRRVKKGETKTVTTLSSQETAREVGYTFLKALKKIGKSPLEPATRDMLTEIAAEIVKVMED